MMTEYIEREAANDTPTLEYPFNVYLASSNGHTFWAAECPDLKGCVGQGETADEAISELRENAKIWMENAEEMGIPIPEVPVRDLDAENVLANAPERDPFNDLTTREKMEADITASITMIVRRTRDELGMSQKEFAEHVDMPEDLISRLESSDYSLKWADTPEYDKDNRIKNQRYEILYLRNRLSKLKRQIESFERRTKKEL